MRRIATAMATAVALWSVSTLAASAAIPPTVSFQGVLAGPPPAGTPKPDGTYNATFRLYAAPTGGTALWTEAKTVQVTGGKGVFVTALGSATAFPPSLTFDQPYYLSVQVVGDAEMAPRLPFHTAPYARRAASLSLPFAGAGPGSGTALSVSNAGATALGGTTTSGVAVRGDATSGIAMRGESDTGTGVLGASGAVHGVQGVTEGPAWAGVFGVNSGPDNTSGSQHPGAGVYGVTMVGGQEQAPGGSGVLGTSSEPWTTGVRGVVTGLHSRGLEGRANGSTGTGVFGSSANGVGVYGSGREMGLWGTSTTGVGLRASSDGTGREQVAIRASNVNPNGGMAAYMTNGSNFATAHFANSGTGEVLYLQNGFGPFIKAVNRTEADTKFIVYYDGSVRSDGNFASPAADFAEMLPAAEGLEPGDVLCIGADGKMVRSSAAYQTSLAGVYSESPGFIGGNPLEGAREGDVPVAIVGVVTVKVTAENGPIAPGDLLTTAAAPGHAMKATEANLRFGACLGKALSGFAGPGSGTLRALVNVR